MPRYPQVPQVPNIGAGRIQQNFGQHFLNFLLTNEFQHMVIDFEAFFCGIVFSNKIFFFVILSVLYFLNMLVYYKN
jgi:hypothetical protein